MGLYANVTVQSTLGTILGKTNSFPEEFVFSYIVPSVFNFSEFTQNASLLQEYFE